MFQHLDDGVQRPKPLYSDPVTTRPYPVPSLSNSLNHTWFMSGRNRKACFAILKLTLGGEEQGMCVGKGEWLRFCRCSIRSLGENEKALIF